MGSGLPGWVVSALGGMEPTVVGAPFSVRVWGWEVLDPLGGLGVAAAGEVGWGVLLAALPAVVLVAVLGRFFCGWLCPYVPILAVSHGVRRALARRGWSAPDVRLPSSQAVLVLLAVLGLTAVLGSQVAPLIYPPSLVGRELFRVIFQGGYGVGLVGLAGAFVFDTFVSRSGFCRTVCPGGALFRVLGALSPVTVRREASACTDCGVCDRVCGLGQSPMTDLVGAGCERCGACVASCPTDALELGVGRRPSLLVEVERARRGEQPEERWIPSRRAFLATLGVTVAGGVAFWAGPGRGAGLRPPGASGGGAFEGRCIRCFRCAEVCPVGAIRFEGGLDLAGVDTPVIDAERQACVLCMACTQVCPTGALEPVSAELAVIASRVRMGVPRLEVGRCIAWSGRGECRACWHACPYPELAVRFVGSGPSGPEFDGSACVGCGQCQQACPDRARAIIIVPQERV